MKAGRGAATSTGRTEESGHSNDVPRRSAWQGPAFKGRTTRSSGRARPECGLPSEACWCSVARSHRLFGTTHDRCAGAQALPVGSDGRVHGGRSPCRHAGRDRFPGVVGDPLRRGFRVGGEILERHPLGPQETAGPVALVQPGEMTFEDHPVEHRQTPSDPITMNILERAHHTPPRRRRYTKVFRRPMQGHRAGSAGPDNNPLHHRARPLAAAERSAASEAALGTALLETCAQHVERPDLVGDVSRSQEGARRSPRSWNGRHR
jgi:hypothetical protein